MKRTLASISISTLLGACASFGNQSFTVAGAQPGTEISVSVSQPTIQLGQRCHITFTLRNSTNVPLRVPVDELGMYSVQGKQIAPVYGRLDPMPEWYYRTLQPGQSMSNSFPVIAGPRDQRTQLPKRAGIPLTTEEPFLLRIEHQGASEIAVSRTGKRLGTLTLNVQ